MSSSSSLAGRAAAVLTTSEVAGATLDLGSNSLDNAVAVEFDFTVGSLDSATVRHYGSSDGTTWRPLSDGVDVLTESLTANATRCYFMRLPGVRYFRSSIQGVGTVTSSSCAFTYRYQLPFTATNTDGALRLN